MFGYIRPLKSEMRVREFEMFRACYCSLCHSISENYGFPASLILNYDFLFLAMLLAPEGEKPELKRRRCAASPVTGKMCCTYHGGFERTGACSVILARWKLKDAEKDDAFPKSLAAGASAAAFSGAYKKAADTAPDFDNEVRSRLSALSALEDRNEASLDRAADEFARLLTAAAPKCGDDARTREIRQILYHTGRWIYITDAVNDLADDMKSGAYNPVAARFALSSPELSPEDRETLSVTLQNSLALIRGAFELMPENAWAGIIRNIIYLGMPAVNEAVFSGRFSDKPGGLPK